MHACAQPTKYQSAVHIDLPTCFHCFMPEVYYNIYINRILTVVFMCFTMVLVAYMYNNVILIQLLLLVKILQTIIQV